MDAERLIQVILMDIVIKIKNILLHQNIQDKVT